MAKRLTDSEKWEDPWFLDLPNEYKLLWIYILDKCDHAGIWKINERLVHFCLGFKPDLNSFVAACKGRVIILSAEKWHIPKFLTFQYGELSESNKMYSRVMSSLQKEGLKMGHISPINGVKREREEERKDKEGIVKGNSFDRFWQAYPKKKSKGDAEKWWFKHKPNEHLQDRILSALEKAKTSAEWTKNGGEFIPYPASWLNAKGWEDDYDTRHGESSYERFERLAGKTK